MLRTMKVHFKVQKRGGRQKEKQAGAELGQAQVKLEVKVKVGVEDKCIYLILSEF